MTLEEATLATLEAAQRGDLEALGRALETRQVALDGVGSSITPGILASGEITAHLLHELIRDIRMETSRLRHIAEGLRPTATPASHVDFVG